MTIPEILSVKRDGGRHTRDHIQSIIDLAAHGNQFNYQVSAWLMAAYIHGLDADETAWLTDSMARSGARLDLTGIPKPWVDKHSTGGVGDKTTLVVLPILASCGLTMVKMSGRGLGITGGTVDKLESIPGFSCELSLDQMLRQAKGVGIALTGQTPDLAPADKVLYSLRDVTATIESIPLIVSSILSKKIAGGAEVIVLDVKCGSGAFMKTPERAKSLATSLVETGARLGVKVEASVTDMDQPLGHAVGNAIEVKEACLTLRGDNPGRFEELCVRLAGHTLCAAGVVRSDTEGVTLAESALKSGRAAETASEWFLCQGANTDPINNLDSLRLSQERVDVIYAGPAGFVRRYDAGVVGSACFSLGAGRESYGQQIDHGVGYWSDIEIGSPIAPGQRVGVVYATTPEGGQKAANQILSAIETSPNRVEASPVFLRNEA